MAKGQIKLNKGSKGQNRKGSEAFIDKYRNKTDVLQCASGLLYRVIDLGEGASPNLQSEVLVHQRILNFDGSVIADTYKTGIADRFSVKEAIAGLQEGLLLMSLGARYEFVVPPELAWGKRGVGNKIGPNAVLQFDVRLVDIV
ncbi:FKBP-type peptidyl-prolyl cis-trans isomerase [Paraglaciecola hydrolytica]|uniref:Peptidyl-prolyl cis-trans isomerase n=1 Tax=Paraglaciecola hydrolytica TaxID=1799789 RepID=A0A136A0L5_9ALTE|nr:FKBP-type peptidyl-prolyl cis-trans isomerase [Paraglaciecola hydrolytica]KXI28747.1 peptidylprolyl isomerase [Paraglaciecola hydrolytica]